MILPFSTQINGKASYFVEKIVIGLSKKQIISLCKASELLETPMSIIQKSKLAKIHTIREDKNDRWKPGIIIDFFINARTKQMFRFAPRIPVISTQKINIEWRGNPYNKNLNPLIWIDHKIFYDREFVFGECKMLELAQNDGFDTIEDFFAYFNTDYTGKIIHWTDKRY